MDREIDLNIRRKRLVKRIAVPLGAAIVLWAVVTPIIGWTQPSVERDDIRIATVERGTVEATINGTGAVVPAFEKVISTPLDLRVLRILQRPGATLQNGQPIVELDLGSARLELQRIERNLGQKHSDYDQLRIDLEEKIADLESRAEGAQLDADVLDSRVRREATLAREGLLSAEAHDETVVQAKKAHLQAKALEDSMRYARQTTAAKLESARREIEVLEQERAQALQQLELSTARSDRDGVLTWVTPEEGVVLQRGAPVARVADLSSYRVAATTSDIHASRVQPGMRVRVVIDEETLGGSVTSVDPTIENGALKFEVALDEPSNPKLHNNRRAEVFVVTGERPSVLRVRKGSLAVDASGGTVFVVDGDRAVARPVRLGLTGYLHHEILSGLDEGENVIISNMENYLQTKEVRIR